MGWQFEGVCYSTQLQAVQAAAGSQVGKVVELFSAPYVIDIGSTTSTTATYLYRGLGDEPPIEKVIALTPQPCGLLEWEDGLQISWLVVAVWLAAYSLKFLSRVGSR